jgi:hypothetical protein
VTLYRAFCRDKFGDEYTISTHKTTGKAMAAAVAAYRKQKLHFAKYAVMGQELSTYGVDARESSDDELIEEIGLVNEETNGEFVCH